MRLLPFLLAAAPAWADPPDILSVEAAPSASGWRFDVRLAHPDTGWDHYADGWRVELADGTVLATRALAHPHVAEMPFTRSLSGIAIPAGVAEVVVRASCNVDGWAAASVRFPLPGGG